MNGRRVVEKRVQMCVETLSFKVNQIDMTVTGPGPCLTPQTWRTSASTPVWSHTRMAHLAATLLLKRVSERD